MIAGTQDRVVTGEAATAFFASLSETITPAGAPVTAAVRNVCVNGAAVAGCDHLHLLDIDVAVALRLPVQKEADQRATAGGMNGGLGIGQPGELAKHHLKSVGWQIYEILTWGVGDGG